MTTSTERSVSADASMCDELRAECATIWAALHAHPLLRELAAGTLPLEKFRYFLEQDNFYLDGYARCLALGAAKSRNETELRYFTTDLRTVLEAELPSNLALLAQVTEMGAADRGGSRTMAPAAVAYTSFMEAVASRGGPLEIMAALLPCAWSYIEIAERLRREGASEHPVYGGWIAFFSLPENVEMVADMRRDFDALAAAEGLTPARRDELGRIFATSSRLEHGFWEMAYGMERWFDLDQL
ncbi:MAG: thiaminase II [Acidimicrobiia bacterium]